MVFKLLCVLLFCCLASCSGGSSGRGKESQYCGEDKFYCPNTRKCLDRNLRCTTSKVCVDSNGEEPKCFKASQGRYNYYRKKSPLSSIFSSRKKRWPELKHWFVEYRGFVYEFGSYGFQELDVNDPNYKYGPGREEVTKEELMGTSRCTRDDVLRFRTDFLRANREYGPISNNCQDFVNFLLRRLESDCSTRKRRSLDDEMKSLKSNCTVSSSSPIVTLNWKLFTSLPVLILFTIFRMY